MDNSEYMVYEQTQVVRKDKLPETIGSLKIIEKDGEGRIVWEPVEQYSQHDWHLIRSLYKDSHGRECVDDTELSLEKFSCPIRDLSSIILSSNRNEVHLVKRGDTLASFRYTIEGSAYFMEVLGQYMAIKEHPDSPNEFMLVDKMQSEIDEKLALLNLVPGKASRRHRAHDSIHHLANAPKAVLGFLHDMKLDPYNTTISTLSKVYDTVLNGYSEECLAEDESRDLLRRVSGFDNLEPGFELVIADKTVLADRPKVERLAPLDYEEFSRYVGPSRRITEVDKLKKRIFKGGIQPTLRSELWCYLLDYYSWGDSEVQRKETIKQAEKQYHIMKQQWKTITKEQEDNFTAFRDRKSLVEKDVMRTDRTHPFYEGEENANLITLNDILMTYVMYDFDLGYVQGMSDLLAPILYVVQNEVTAFWCFVGFMKRVHKNFELTQEGMKEQLKDLTTILQIVDPLFFSFLQSQDSANMTFCFRWLLVRFKREFKYVDVIRLWEILWTGYPCENFHLLFASSILCSERNKLIDNKLQFAEVLKHINDLNYKIDLETALMNSEAIYLQLKATETLPNPVREIIGLPLKSVVAREALSLNQEPRHLPGRVQRVTETTNDEKNYEEALFNTYM